jgi:ABC-type transport system involved in multi-copper enzyme maturation permease subunit
MAPVDIAGAIFKTSPPSMRFLPIVERELREGSRRPSTYWSRVSVAFLACLVGVAAFLINYFQPKDPLGTILFWGLSGLSMLSCLLAGRAATADCLSREKREGTLGLLFLTDLKGYDVVLGKLVATSLAAFYALLTILPVLAIPLLVGGMTNGEFWRMALVLVNSFFFSLAVGILASAATRQYRAAMAANFFLFTLVVGVPVACGVAYGITHMRTLPPFFYSCPVFSFVMCADAQYTAAPADFWWSLATTHLLAWIFVAEACQIVPRAWADKPAVAASGRWRWREIGPLLSYGAPAQRVAFRKDALDANAFFWLAARAWLKPVHVWIFLGLAAIWWIHGWISNGVLWLDVVTYISTSYLLNVTFKLWVALEAGHQLGEDRRAGAFELLLVTPLTVGDILRGQFQALRRQFLRPLVVVVAVEFLFAVVLARRPDMGREIFFLLGGILLLLADMAALTWVSILSALTTRNPASAVMTTVSRVLVFPWVVLGGIMGIWHAVYLLDLTRLPPTESFPLGLWLATGFLADVFFGFRAWKALRLSFREIALRPLLKERRRFGWRQFRGKMAAVVRESAGRILAPQIRKPAFISLAVILVVACVLLYRGRPTAPPPVLVSITQSNTPMSIYHASQGVFMVLPDGTLWRWGRTFAGLPRAVVPVQVGTDHDWAKALGSDSFCLGLHSDGTMCQWRDRYGVTNLNSWPGQLWLDIGAGWNYGIAIRKDGTLWEWPLISGRPQPPPKKFLSQIGDATNWAAVSTRGDQRLGLRSDGTLWVWGRFAYLNGTAWTSQNFSNPTQVCADTNWTALDATGLARNRSGELWSAWFASPDAKASASSVCTLMTSNWAAAHIHSEPFWEKAQVRSDGSLWLTTVPPFPAAPASAQEWHQLGSRSDWIDLWGVGGTWFGLTADGTLWVWGFDLGAEPQAGATFASRLQLLKQRLAGQRIVPSQQRSPPMIKRPRPLLRLVQKR